MELSKFDIKYEPRGPIKGQIFADFVVELSSEASRVEGDDFRWVLSVDGSSNQQGSGAGVILEGPNGVLIEQSLRFAFDPAGNLNVGESLRNTFCPVFATASPEESPSELSLSDGFKM